MLKRNNLSFRGDPVGKNNYIRVDEKNKIKFKSATS